MTTFTDPTTGEPLDTPCQHEDAEIWFSNDELVQRHAKQLCATCPAVAVRACLKLALDTEERGHGYRHGIWAGLTANQRSRIADGRLA